ncbi:MAG TPA: hypothetical protein DCQ45_08965 [Erysipelotrichaceae bacterium]|nr:hypothetical protein [Erysipelotrichaceae bacterium]
MLIMTIVYLILLLLLALSARTKYYLYAKTASSLCFVVIAIVGAISRHAMYTLLLMLPGLLAFMLGDMILAFKSKHSLLLGIIAFSIGDLAFLHFLLYYHDFGLSSLLLSVIALISYVFIAKKGIIDFGELLIPSGVYAFLEGLVVMKSILVYRVVPTRFFLFIMIGMILYLISDLVLMVFKFKKKSLAIGAAALALYYGGLYCLAICFFFI